MEQQKQSPEKVERPDHIVAFVAESLGQRAELTYQFGEHQSVCGQRPDIFVGHRQATLELVRPLRDHVGQRGEIVHDRPRRLGLCTQRKVDFRDGSTQGVPVDIAHQRRCRLDHVGQLVGNPCTFARDVRRAEFGITYRIEHDVVPADRCQQLHGQRGCSADENIAANTEFDIDVIASEFYRAHRTDADTRDAHLVPGSHSRRGREVGGVGAFTERHRVERPRNQHEHEGDGHPDRAPEQVRLVLRLFVADTLAHYTPDHRHTTSF